MALKLEKRLDTIRSLALQKSQYTVVLQRRHRRQKFLNLEH